MTTSTRILGVTSIWTDAVALKIATSYTFDEATAEYGEENKAFDIWFKATSRCAAAGRDQQVEDLSCFVDVVENTVAETKPRYWAAA